MHLDQQTLFREGSTEVKVTPETFCVVDHDEPQATTYVRWDDGRKVCMVYECLTGDDEVKIEKTQNVVTKMASSVPKRVYNAFIYWLSGRSA